MDAKSFLGKNKKDRKMAIIISAIMLFMVGGLILMIVLVLPDSPAVVIDTGTKSDSIETQAIQVNQPQPPETQKDEEFTKEQEAVADFLAEIAGLNLKANKGNDEITKLGKGLQSGGLTLPYAVSAQLIFEAVLEEARGLKVPSGGEKVKSYFIEGAQYQLTGVESIRAGLESAPMNESKMWQGLETYNKSMLSTARCTEEINKLKAKVGLK